MYVFLLFLCVVFNQFSLDFLYVFSYDLIHIFSLDFVICFPCFLFVLLFLVIVLASSVHVRVLTFARMFRVFFKSFLSCDFFFFPSFSIGSFFFF